MKQRLTIWLFDLELSDAHLTHVYRFLRLGKFDRAQHEAQRGIAGWKLAERRAQDQRDGVTR